MFLLLRRQGSARGLIGLPNGVWYQNDGSDMTPVNFLRELLQFCENRNSCGLAGLTRPTGSGWDCEMAYEIERKFLVEGRNWGQGSGSRRIRQGYLSADPERSVRVRLVGDDACLTVKGATTGWTRVEFEYPIPTQDALHLLDELCIRPVIDKTRHEIRYGAHRWEIDEFHGANEGLVIAEIELAAEGEHFERPPWLGAEVSDDPRYYNVNLARQPFNRW
jgi:adenylate cyclase